MLSLEEGPQAVRPSRRQRLAARFHIVHQFPGQKIADLRQPTERHYASIRLDFKQQRIGGPAVVYVREQARSPLKTEATFPTRGHLLQREIVISESPRSRISGLNAGKRVRETWLSSSRKAGSSGPLTGAKLARVLLMGPPLQKAATTRWRSPCGVWRRLRLNCTPQACCGVVSRGGSKTRTTP